MDKVHYSSKSNEWETPLPLYKELDKEFNFTLDPCATDTTAKCGKFYTKEDNGLLQDWGKETVYVNPPYGREIKDWVAKAYQEYRKGVTVVMLLPARTDTRWFHEYIYNEAEIRFLKGRVKFLQRKEELHPAPFPSMVVIFKHKSFWNIENWISLWKKN